MSDTREKAQGVRRRRKVMAVASAGLALGLAAVLSLAAWNDSEWVFGGLGPGGGGDEGVGTSEFEVQQNAWEGATAPTTASSFTDHETNPGNALLFDVDPTGLTPGTTIYAPVALTTTAESVAGTLTLTTPAVAANGKTADDPDGLLWDNLIYSVRVTDDAATAANCQTDFASAGTAIVTDSAFSDSVTTGTQSLSAARGNVQYYCFAITLPDNATTQTLQGLKVFPAWRFHATSS
ncbi:MAG: hypothetical protein QM621_08775 [Aeromicrobium sp.]|uniref:hypothetical protein n=1 Tax=Aeromicrobium sp. TaxID=1871063 RepID=UPI0039E22ADA